MELKTALSKMEEMLALMNEFYQNQLTQEKRDHLVELYAQVEELIHQFEGLQTISVPGFGKERPVYKDYVAAGWLAASTVYVDEGRTQLIKVMSKIRSRLTDPGKPEVPASVDQLLRALGRFRECCQFIRAPPGNEQSVQDIVWIMLRAQFDRVDRENVLPRFGAKTYRPDFGVPDLRTLVEVKYIGPKTDVGAIQEEILADVPGYLSSSSEYAGIVALVYDAAHKLRDPRKFIEDLGTVEGISQVIVVPGIGTPVES
jgi:hypothetical protein